MIDAQTRISLKHDNIRKKILENNIRRLGFLTDTIRVRSKLNREGDIISRVVTESNVVHIVYPPMKDVPIRDLQKENGTYTLTSLVASVGAGDQEVPEFYTIQAPRTEYLQVGDILFRVLMEPDMKYPSVLALTITEKLATFGANSIIMNSYKVAINMEELPQKMIDVVVAIAKRRLYLKY